MADVEVVGPLVLAKVEEKSGKRKDGSGEWQLWKAWFVGQPNEKGASTTFSSTCGKALGELFEKQTPAIYHLKEDKEFQGRMEYTIEKIVSAEDQKTVLYEPDSKDGKGKRTFTKGGPPDWSMRTPEERLEERCSIEAQKALEYAIRTLEAVLPFDSDMTRDGAVEFVKATHTEYTALIRSAVFRGAGSGSRSSGTGGSSEKSGSDGQRKLARPGAKPAAAPEGPSSSEHDAEGPASFRQGAESASHPSPESAPVDTTVLDSLTGSASKTKLAFKKHFDLPATKENMTPERLDELVGALQDA